MNIEGQEGLYDFLNSQELYTKSLEEFKDQFSTPEKQSILYERLSSNGLYDKSEEEFTNQFFGAEKKNPIETEDVIETETIQPDQMEVQSLTEEPIQALETPIEDNTDSQQVSEKPKSSSAGGMLQMATPSASESQKPKPGQSQGQLLMAPVKGKKIEDVLKQEKKKWDVTSLNWFNPNKPVKIDIPTVTKKVAEASKNLAQKSKELEKNRIQLESEVKAFENAYKANPKDPNLPKLKLELDKKLNAHNALSSQFQLDINNVNQDRADIKKAMAEKFIDEKDKGSFLGATWNSIVEGYKKIGESQARIAIDLGIELLNSVGIPVSADKKMTKDEAKKAVISEMMPILSKGYDVAKSKGTTEAYIQQQKTKGVLPKAWFGVAESLPVMASGGGTVGRFVTGASMAYQYANEELDSNPNTANMDENERKKITVPIAVIGGVLEELGFRTLIGKNKPALIKLSSYIVKQLPTNATIETIKEVTSKAVKGPIMKEIVSTGTKLGTGYLGEAETGGAQKALDVITKEIYDSSNNVEFFKNPEIFSKEFLSKVAEDANIEGLGGVMMRGIGIGASTAMSVTGVGQMSDKEYAAWKDLATNEASGQLYLSKVIADLSTGRITKPEAEKRISDFNRATEIAKQIPDNLSVADQKKAFSIIAENQKIDAGIKDLQKYMEGKNPNLVTNINKQIEGLQKRIQDNNTQLTKLSENAVQEQTTSQVPVQPEAGTSQQVAEGEPQAEPQVPTQEGQGQEVAPTTGGGGMIQMAPGSMPSQQPTGEQPTTEPTAQPSEEQPTTEQPTEEQPTEEQPTTEQQAEEQSTTEEDNSLSSIPGYDRMMGEVDGIIDKSLKRGVPYDKAMDNALQYMQKSKAYQDATDIQREQMVRDIRKMFDKKEKKAPGVEKLGLKPKPQKATVNTMTVLKERLKEIDKSIKEGQRNFKQAVKDMAAEIKSVLPKGVFSTAQMKIVANALSSNLLNPKLRQEAIERVNRMVNNVIEATKLKEAYDLRTKIRKANVENLGVELQDLAKGFAQIDPRYINNLDEHLDQARQVFDAIRNVKFKKDEDGNTIVDPRSIIPFAPAQDYTQKQLDKQEEIIKDALLQQHANLVAEGKINDSMSLAQIQAYVKSLAEDPSKSKEEKDQALRDYAQQSFNESKEELQDAIDDGAIDEDDVPLIEGFTKMDLSLLDPMQAYEAAEALMNYRVNGSTSKMGKVLANYVGALGVKTITENVRRDGQVHVGGTRYLRYKALGKALDKLIQGFSFGSLKTNLSEKFGSAYSDLWLELNGTLDNLGVTYFGPNNWKAIKEASGLDDIIKGVVQRKIIVEQFRKEIHDKYKGKKIGKDGVFTTKNAYMLGILSNLYRQTSDAKQKDTYFDKRKKVLRETIDYLLSSEDNDERKKGELLNEIYEELDIENATNGKEIFDNADPVAKEIINDFINKFKQYYPSFSRVAQQQFNILLGQDQNYTPDSWINVGKTSTSASDKLFKRGNFTMNNDIVDTEETGRFIKPKYPDGLPKRNGKVSRIASYDFFQNNMDAFAETVNTVKTINGVNQYVGFVDSPEFSKLITNEAAREFFKDRVNYNVSLYQMNEKVGKRRGFSKGIVDFFKIPTKLGTTVGLSSIQSMATQSLPIVTNTVLNLRNPAYMLLATQYLGNKDMQEFLNNSDYGISERGHSAQTNIDYADNMLERGDYSTAEKTKELLKKASRYWVDKVLVGTDVLTAKATWMAYYMDELAKQGINPLKIDWKTHEINDQAAKYAETMVQREQNVNLPESGGKLWSSKDSRMRLARMLMPFASFTTSQKDKIKANMAVLFMNNNLATKEEKIAAARSIVASAGEQYVFNSIKSAIVTQLMAGAYGIADEKETEEEEKLRKKKESFKLYADIFDAFNGSVDFLEKESGAIVNNFLLRATENLMNLYEYAVENNMTLEELKKEIKKMNWGADNKIEKDEVQIYPFGDARAFKTQAQIKRDKLKEELKKPFRFYESEEASSPETVARMFGGVPKAAYDTWARFVTEDLPDIYSKSTTSEDGEEAEFTQEDAGKLLMAIPIKVGAGFGAIPREIKNLSDYTTKIIKDKTNINYKRRRAGRKREMKNMYN